MDAVDGEKATLEEIARLFLLDAPVCLDKLRTAVATGDAGQTGRAAHSLKGAVAVLGATTAYALAADLEAMGQAGHLEGAATVLQRLADEIGEVAAFFADPDWAACL